MLPEAEKPGAGDGADQPAHPDQDPRTPDRRPTRHHRRAIFTSRQVRHRPRCRRWPRSATPAAGSPHPKHSPAGRSHTLNQTIRQGQGRHLPLGVDKQLRGAVIDSPATPGKRTPGPPISTPKPEHDGQDHPDATRILARLAPHHLALLARSSPLRPRQTQRAATVSRSVEQGIMPRCTGEYRCGCLPGSRAVTIASSS